MRDTYRWDEPEEKKIFFLLCVDCQWESCSESAPDDLSDTVCPVCGSENLEEESDYV